MSSVSTKKKLVAQEMLGKSVNLLDEEIVAKVLVPKGNYLYEVETQGGLVYLASMPTKFRNTVWIKRGNFVVVEEIKEGNKVKGEITKVLMNHHVKCLKKEGRWPSYFLQQITPDTNVSLRTSSSSGDSSYDSGD